MITRMFDFLSTKNLRLYYSPYFICRFYIRQCIKEFVQKYKFKGTVIDVGCGQKPYKDIFLASSKYEGIDFKSFSSNKDFKTEAPDYFFDKTYQDNFKLPFKNESFDNSVSFQVLEHHQKPQTLISELVRITKKKGYIFITVPFIGGLHEAPHDYQRYTKYGLIELFKEHPVSIVKIQSCGSVMSTIVCLFNEYINVIAAQNRLGFIIALFLYPLDMFLQYLSLFVDKILVSEHIVFNYCILVKKNG